MSLRNIYGDGPVVRMVRNDSTDIRIFITLAQGVWIAAVVVMLYGNIKGKMNFTLLYIYWKIAHVLFLALCVVLIVFTCIFYLQFILGIFAMLFETIQFAVDVYFWHVVACRVLEMERNKHRLEAEKAESMKQITGGPPETPVVEEPENASAPEIEQ